METRPEYDTLTNREIISGFIIALLVSMGLSRLAFFFRRKLMSH